MSVQLIGKIHSRHQRISLGIRTFIDHLVVLLPPRPVHTFFQFLEDHIGEVHNLFTLDLRFFRTTKARYRTQLIPIPILDFFSSSKSATYTPTTNTQYLNFICHASHPLKHEPNHLRYQYPSLGRQTDGQNDLRFPLQHFLREEGLAKGPSRAR